MTKTKRPHGAAQKALICLLLAVVTIAVYWPVIGYGFVDLDDGSYVRDNLRVNAGLSSESVAWALRAIYKGTWQPIVWISYMVDRDVSAFFLRSDVGHPGVCHLTNLLVHVANTLLLFLVLGAMTGSRWRSAFVALIFAIHPLHVESVAWIAERKGLLSNFFGLLAMLAYLNYTRQPSVGRYLLVALALGLGLMCKPMLMSLPVLLLLLDYWPLERTGLRWRLVVEKLPLLAMSAASLVITFIAQREGGAMTGLDSLPLLTRAANSAVSYVAYIAKTIWPNRLAVCYPHPGTSVSMLAAAGALTLLVLITFVAVRGARRRPYVPVGWLWYLITLLPVIGLVQVGPQAMADRYSYVPLTGLFIIVAWGIADMLPARGALRRLLPWAAAGVAALLLICTHYQIQAWRSAYTLADHAIRVTDRNSWAYYLRGVAVHREGKTEEAINDFRTALELQPDFAAAHNDLGAVLIATGQTEEGMRHLESARDLGHDSPMLHYNLACGYLDMQMLDEAEEQCLNALSLDPEYADAHNVMGLILQARGRLDEAISHFRSAVASDPRKADPHGNLATTHFLKGDYPAAWRELHIFVRRGGRPNPRLVADLSRRMPDPGP